MIVKLIDYTFTSENNHSNLSKAPFWRLKILTRIIYKEKSEYIFVKINAS